MVCCGFAACWSFNGIYYAVNFIRGGSIDLSSWLYHFSMVLVFVSSCINPLIYAAKYREFQTVVRRLMGQQVHPSHQFDVAPAS